MDFQCILTQPHDKSSDAADWAQIGYTVDYPIDKLINVIIFKWSPNRSPNRTARVESESEPGPSGTAHLWSIDRSAIVIIQVCFQISVSMNVHMFIVFYLINRLSG